MAQTSDLTRRLCIAVEWHAVALANASAVTWQQRIIALKTGFEALLGTSNSREGAKMLRALFESTAKGHEHLFPTANVLWSPKERADLSRPFKGKPDVMSEVEDWFMALANARNDIIHEGKITNTEYAAPPERPLSRYAGSLFWIGERVLREAIKARLGACIWLCGPLKTYAAWEKLRQALAAVPQPTTTAEPPASSGVPSTTTTAAPPRPVKALIAELACPAANHVQMVYKSVGSSASEKAAREMAEPCWVAKVGAKEIWISETEHDLLEKAGAEQALPDHVIVCD
jgi:hypothetical protein